MNLEDMKRMLEVDIKRDMIEDLYHEDLEKLQSMASKMRQVHFGKKITFYTKPYEPVSLTGSSCGLSCKHCNRHYLMHMQQIKDGKGINKLFRSLKGSGVNGLVLSGGSRLDGSVPTYEYAKEIKRAKKATCLVLNAHTGIVSEKQAKKLSYFLDAALTDVIGDPETVKEILGLDHGPEDYRKTLANLRNAGIRNLSPHIIVGLNHGEIRGELKALSLLSECDPDNIVIVVFIPTKGTEMEKDAPPKIEEVAKVISLARIMYPEKNVSLSCVRPGGRYRNALDKEAVKSGVNKIAVPSKAAYKAAEEFGLEIEEMKESRCCSW